MISPRPRRRPAAVLFDCDGVLADGTVRLAKVRDLWQGLGMSTTSNPYRGYRFPAEVIRYAVWLYCEIVRVAWLA